MSLLKFGLGEVLHSQNELADWTVNVTAMGVGIILQLSQKIVSMTAYIRKSGYDIHIYSYLFIFIRYTTDMYNELVELMTNFILVLFPYRAMLHSFQINILYVYD